MVYKSKIGVGMVSVLAVVYTACSLLMLFDDSWPAILIITPVFVLVAYTLFTTRYIVEGENLTIKSGPFYNKIFSIKAFRKIVKTNSLITAPASSTDRIELFFNGYDSVVISPKDKDAFINHLKSINPAIVYEG